MERKMFETKVVSKIKSHILCSMTFFFPGSRAVYLIMWKKYGRSRQAADNNMAHALCMLDNWGKNTETHSEYLILIASPWKQWLRERVLVFYVSRTLPVLLHWTSFCLVKWTNACCILKRTFGHRGAEEFVFQYGCQPYTHRLWANSHCISSLHSQVTGWFSASHMGLSLEWVTRRSVEISWRQFRSHFSSINLAIGAGERGCYSGYATYGLGGPGFESRYG